MSNSHESLALKKKDFKGYLALKEHIISKQKSKYAPHSYSQADEKARGNFEGLTAFIALCVTNNLSLQQIHNIGIGLK